jgi:ribosomal protein S8
MFNDTISDVLTRIRNAGMVDSSTVRIPLTRMSQQLCHILEKEGFRYFIGGNQSKSPFTNQVVDEGMDLTLDIFATRI